MIAWCPFDGEECTKIGCCDDCKRYKCKSCQEFNCDFCPYKEIRKRVEEYDRK